VAYAGKRLGFPRDVRWPRLDEQEGQDVKIEMRAQGSVGTMRRNRYSEVVLQLLKAREQGHVLIVTLDAPEEVHFISGLRGHCGNWPTASRYLGYKGRIDLHVHRLSQTQFELSIDVVSLEEPGVVTPGAETSARTQ
jgi:hypothetical protein